VSGLAGVSRAGREGCGNGKCHSQGKRQDKGTLRGQTGYRACYRKLIVNVEKAQRGMDAGGELPDDALNELVDNWWEAFFTGDPKVMDELEAYWPLERQEKRKLPYRERLPRLKAAMRVYTSETLTEHEERRARLRQAGPDF
jgi:hypothetical protein